MQTRSQNCKNLAPPRRTSSRGRKPRQVDHNFVDPTGLSFAHPKGGISSSSSRSAKLAPEQPRPKQEQAVAASPPTATQPPSSPAEDEPRLSARGRVVRKRQVENFVDSGAALSFAHPRGGTRAAAATHHDGQHLSQTAVHAHPGMEAGEASLKRPKGITATSVPCIDEAAHFMRSPPGPVVTSRNCNGSHQPLPTLTIVPEDPAKPTSDVWQQIPVRQLQAAMDAVEPSSAGFWVQVSTMLQQITLPPPPPQQQPILTADQEELQMRRTCLNENIVPPNINVTAADCQRAFAAQYSPQARKPAGAAEAATAADLISQEGKKKKTVVDGPCVHNSDGNTESAASKPSACAQQPNRGTISWKRYIRNILEQEDRAYLGDDLFEYEDQQRAATAAAAAARAGATLGAVAAAVQQFDESASVVHTF